MPLRRTLTITAGLVVFAGVIIAFVGRTHPSSTANDIAPAAPAAPALSRMEVVAYYDWIGSWLEVVSKTYEAPVTAAMVDRCKLLPNDFVLEYGHGTGFLADHMLRERLNTTATPTASATTATAIAANAAVYHGIDVSTTMHQLTSERLSEWIANGTAALTLAATDRVDPVAAIHDAVITRARRPVDAFVSTYVFDLLSDEQLHAVIGAAHSALRPTSGRVCLTSLSRGHSGLSYVLTQVWEWAYGYVPSWLGGCRPIQLKQYLPANQWNITTYELYTAFGGLASEIVVAHPIAIAK